MPKSRKVLRRLAVSEKVGLSPVQVWRKANDPDDDFPEGRILGPNSTGWFEDEVDAWLENRPRGCGQRKAHLEPHYNRPAKDEVHTKPAAQCRASPVLQT